MDFIPRELLLPLLAITMFIFLIVLLWPSDLKVYFPKPKPPPPPDDDEEEPPPYDGMASS